MAGPARSAWRRTNGGALVSYADADGTVLVTVTVGGESATARAAMLADEHASGRALRTVGDRAPPVT